MEIQTYNKLKFIINNAVESMINDINAESIKYNNTLIKKIINECITENQTGSICQSAKITAMFSGRGRAWARIDKSKSSYNDIIRSLEDYSHIEDTTDLIDLFESAGFAWMRFSSASSKHIQFNLRIKGSKLEDSILFRMPYSKLEEIDNLEGVPHRLGLESGDFKMNIKQQTNFCNGDHTLINSNIISIEDII